MIGRSQLARYATLHAVMSSLLQGWTNMINLTNGSDLTGLTFFTLSFVGDIIVVQFNGAKCRRRTQAATGFE